MNVNMQSALCRNFCPYYKPSKNEELACMGYLVVKRLLNKGRKIFFEKSQKKLDEATEEALVRIMCGECSFYKDGCDFVMAYQNRKDTGSISTGKNTPSTFSLDKAAPAQLLPGKGRIVDAEDRNKYPPPCGGFVLLGHLLEKGILSIDDIRNMV
jgi:hypothetical protein